MKRLNALLPGIIAALTLFATILSADEQTPDSVNTANTVTGHRFEQWETKGGVKIENSRAAVSPAAVEQGKNLEVTANYRAPDKKLTLILRTEGRGSTTPDPNKYMDFPGEKHALLLKANPSDDSRFVCWKVLAGDAAIEKPNEAETNAVLSKNSVIVAVFEATECAVRIHIHGRGDVRTHDNVEWKDGVIRVKTNEPFKLTAENLADSRFARWATSGNLKSDDLLKEETAFVPTGYHGDVQVYFNGWLENFGDPIVTDPALRNASGSGGGASAPPIQAVALTIATSGRGTTDPIPGVYSGAPSKVRIQAVPSPNMKFVRWHFSGGAQVADPLSPLADTTVAGNGHVSAEFIPEIALLKVSNYPEANGSSLPKRGEMCKVKTSEGVEINAEPSPGFLFRAWRVLSGDASFDNAGDPKTKVTLKADSVIVPVFELEKKPEPVAAVPPPKLNPSDNFTVQKPPTAKIDPLITVGANGELRVKTPPGLYFVSWKVTGKARVKNLFAENTSVTFDRDANETNSSLSAVFDTIKAELKLEVSGNGTTQPLADSTTIVPILTPVAIQAKPAPGMEFVRWTVVGGANLENEFAPSTKVTLDYAAILTAEFKPKPLKIRVTATEGGITSPAGFVDLAPGSTLPLAAAPAKGYRFVKWEIPDSMRHSGNTTSRTRIRPKESGTVRAVFSRHPASLTVAVDGLGTVTPEACKTVEVTPGEPIRLRVVPGNDWRFECWDIQGDAKIDTPNRPISDIRVLDGNVLVIARLSKITRERTEDASVSKSAPSTDPAERVRMAAEERAKRTGKKLVDPADSTEKSKEDASSSRKNGWVVATDGLYPGKVKIFWNYPNAVLFDIERRRMDADDDHYELLVSNWSTTTYEDVSVLGDAIYEYRIRAKARNNAQLDTGTDLGFAAPSP